MADDIHPAKRRRNGVEDSGDTPAEKSRNEEDEVVSSSDDDDFGPALPGATADGSGVGDTAAQARARKRKRRKLQHEALYLSDLPQGLRYSKSLMHKDQLSYVTMTPYTGFLVTASVNGQVNFWKKRAAALESEGGAKNSADSTTGEGADVEFVKEFRAHDGEITAVAVSWDGRNYASCGRDGTIKVWDVSTFDLIAALKVAKIPVSLCWCYGRASEGGGSLPLLAVGNEVDGDVDVHDGRGERDEPVFTVKGVHRKPVVTMSYNERRDCVISADSGGMVEYWRPGPTAEKPADVFSVKSSTGLFEFRKAKSVPSCITFAPNGEGFATLSYPDRQVRLFDYATGKMVRCYSESLDTLQEMQQAGTGPSELESTEFARRLAVERDLDVAPSDASRDTSQPSVLLPHRARTANIIFDASGHLLFVPSLYGIKVLNTLTNRLLRIYGADESFRALHLALYTGGAGANGSSALDGRAGMSLAQAASANPILQERATARNTMLVSTGAGKPRFYIFTDETEVTKGRRDVQNEKPVAKPGANDKTKKDAASVPRNTAATIHTTLGDIHVRLLPAAAPNTCENFITHARRGYYNNVLFHRVIRKFMIQTGDPLGDGTGGESIWGREFADEFHPSLKHDRPYTLSMANAGPNTNGSQFFITTERTPWLDGKHTIFGRADRGLDVIHMIENVKTKKEKPEEDIKIVNITVE